MADNLELIFYKTQFQRGQIDVSSNVARHLSRLPYYRTEHPPFMPRREFQLTLTGDFDDTDTACYNYASIFFPASLLGSGGIGDKEGETLYYFVEFDPDDVGNSVNARVMRFYLDEWATVTSGAARTIGAKLVTAVGTLERGHLAPVGLRLSPITAPAEQLRVATTLPHTSVRSGGDVVLIAVCTEKGSNEVEKTRLLCLADENTNVSRIAAWSSVISSPYGVAMVDVAARASELADLIENYGLVGYTYDANGVKGEHTFSGLTIDQIVAVPRDLLPTYSEYPFASPVEVFRDLGMGTTPQSIGNRLVWIGYGIYGGYSHFKRKGYTIPQSDADVYTFGNVGQHLTLTPCSTSYYVYAALSMRPQSGTLAVFIGDGLNEIEITESLVVPFSAISDPTAKATQGVRDVLAAVSIGGSVATGAITGNPVAVGAGVIQAAGLAADVFTRYYAATRQTVGSGLRNIAANSDAPETVAGCVRVEYYSPSNRQAIEDGRTRFGWQGARPCNAVTVPRRFAYYQYADDVALDLEGMLESFPWLASSVRDLLVRGLRVWNDEDVTRYKDYAAAAAVTE